MPHEQPATTGRSLLSGGLWNGLNYTLPQFYTLIQSIVAARILGAGDMGRQSFIAWAAVTVKLLVTGGVPRSLTRFVADAVGRRDPARAQALVRYALRIETGAALLGSAILVAVAIARPELRTAWLLAAVACGFSALHGVPFAVVVGTQQWRRSSAVGLSVGAVSTVATVVVLLAGGGITGMFAVEAAIAAASVAGTLVLARGALGPRIREAHREQATAERREFNRYAGLISILIIFEVVVWKRSEFFFLERYAVAEEIAHYSVAFAAAAALVQLTEGLAGVLSPAVATLLGAGEVERVKIGFNRALRLLTLVTLPLVAGAASIGPSLILTVYGEEYRPASLLIVVLVASLPLVPSSVLSTSLLIASGRVKQALLAILVAAVVDVTAAAVLVPRWESRGASIANVLGQVTLCSVALPLARTVVGRLNVRPSSLARTLLAAVVAFVAPWATLQLWPGPAGVAIAIVLWGITFAGACRILRVLSSEDAAWLQEAVGDRAGGRVGRLVALVSAPSEGASP